MRSVFPNYALSSVRQNISVERYDPHLACDESSACDGINEEKLESKPRGLE